MLKGILGIVVSVGLVYAQTVNAVQHYRKANDMTPTHTVKKMRHVHQVHSHKMNTKVDKNDTKKTDDKDMNKNSDLSSTTHHKNHHVRHHRQHNSKMRHHAKHHNTHYRGRSNQDYGQGRFEANSRKNHTMSYQHHTHTNIKMRAMEQYIDDTGPDHR